MKVQPNNFPNTERLRMSDRRYVYLVAKVGGATKETVILVSEKIANVFLQTDKPLYTPKQTGEA